MFLSIITVCYNSAGTIRQTFESVLQQDFNDYEYIVVDGASTDGTLGIIQEYLPKFNGKMRYVSEKDNGIYDAMNKGIRMAQGEVIGLVNSDDFYEKNAFARIYDAVRNVPDADVYYGLVRVLAQGDEEIKLYRLHHKMLYSCPLAHAATFITKAAYKKFGQYDTFYRISADYDLLLRIFLQGGVYQPVDYILANFRMGGVSSGENNIPEHLMVQYKHELISGTKRYLSLFVYHVKCILRKILKRQIV
ncbi:MAG: glycosyltransferase [Lentisphaeria bacterium]|nr:glycosyltransferase [Lentisphaeria bacterium]MBO7329827.1 glycosyltransferase [Lentisphaeria bacterium]